MIVRSIRRIYADSNHNMCTGAAWFAGALFVGFRQGDAHVSPNGKVIVLRSRDEGVSFEHVALLRGQVDTRDAHLYKVGEKHLHCVCFETVPTCITGTAWTEDGLTWSPYTRYTGADGWWLWHPECRDGKHYAVGYTWASSTNGLGIDAIAWFESDDGIAWRKIAILRQGSEIPSETNLVFRDNGEALLLVRREGGQMWPLLMTSKPPYREWTTQEIEVPIVGLAMWLVGDEIWFAGRWFLKPSVAQMGVFRLEAGNSGGKPVLQMVLPAGPGFDFSYMGVARHPLNSSRFALSYYSNHTAPDDPKVDQWSHPAIYLVDALYERPFVRDWQVSEVTPLVGGLSAAQPPDPGNSPLRWQAMQARPKEQRGETGFVDATKWIANKPGVLYFVTDLELGPTGRGAMHVGYDGPVRIWLNGREVFAGPGTNPAKVDQTSIPVEFQHGHNRVAIALDTNGGRACGVFLRYEGKA
ncbi:MAG: hypothetical protein NTW19_12250 [Planctomycetota bacterium]|nr:hypothetical protein [Planctomycetota bacterium]